MLGTESPADMFTKHVDGELREKLMKKKIGLEVEGQWLRHDLSEPPQMSTRQRSSTAFCSITSRGTPRMVL